MKALSGYAEWFYCMCRGWKDVENRNWPLPAKVKQLLPVRIYLHASKTKTPDCEVEIILENLNKKQSAEFRGVDWSKYRGAIIGETTIMRQVERVPPGFETLDGFVSEWFFGNYGFVVQDGVLFEKPIPMKGRLGFFEVTLQKVVLQSGGK